MSDDQQQTTAMHSQELESIASFYGKDFNNCDKETVDETGLLYEIWVRKDLEWSASIRFSLPDKYPDIAPVFDLYSAWMTEADLEELTERFGEKLNENNGKAVGVLDAWIGILREFAESKASTDLGKKIEVNEKEEEDEPELKDEEDEQAIARHDELPKESICPKIVHGDQITDRKSTFLAHLAVITSKDQVTPVLSKLKEHPKISKARYNIWAYRIFDTESNGYIEDCDDDGESAAGGRLLHLLETSHAQNVIIIVTRWHGNIELGPERFKHINECAKGLLQEQGIIESKTDNSKGKDKTKPKTKPKNKRY